MGTASASGGRRRTRRSAEEGEAFRRQLIAAAKALFVEEGYQAVSIRKITERAQCPTMTFYVYFRNKRELLRHIWDDILELAADCADAAAAGVEDPEAALEAYLRAWRGYWLDNPDNYRLVFVRQDLPADGEGRDAADRFCVRARFATLGGLLARGIAEGRFAPVAPELAAQALLAQAIGVAHCLATLPEYAWDSALADHALGRAIRGLKP